MARPAPSRVSVEVRRVERRMRVRSAFATALVLLAGGCAVALFIGVPLATATWTYLATCESWWCLLLTSAAAILSASSLFAIGFGFVIGLPELLALVGGQRPAPSSGVAIRAVGRWLTMAGGFGLAIGIVVSGPAFVIGHGIWLSDQDIGPAGPAGPYDDPYHIPGCPSPPC